jgi:hypothetical protein
LAFAMILIVELDIACVFFAHSNVRHAFLLFIV